MVDERLKEAVCSAFANVLRRSPLGAWIDPDAFAATLGERFAALFSAGTLDLDPIWHALTPGYEPAALSSVVTRLKEEGQRLGVRVKVRDLDPSLIELTSLDVRPIIPEATRRRVINAMIKSIKSCPAGWKIKGTDLRSWLDREFERLCDGMKLELEPVHRMLSSDFGFAATDEYIAIVRLEDELKGLDLRVVEPKLGLSMEVRHELAREARRTAEPADDDATPAANRPLRLGELLLRYQLIKPEALDRALEQQRALGGRLGSNLVKLGLIGESELAHFLSVQLNLPAIDPAELSGLSSRVLSALPIEIVRKYRIVPIALVDKSLKLAMADPADLKVIDEIAFVTGFRVFPVVAPELLIDYALDRYYSLPKEEAPLPITADLLPAAETVPLELPLREPAEPPPVMAPIEPAARFERVEPPPEPQPSAGQDLGAELIALVDHEQVLRAALRSGARELEIGALFAVDGAKLVGLDSAGGKLAGEAFRQISFPLQGSLLFRDLHTDLSQQSAHHRFSPQDSALLEKLGITPNGDLMSIPIREKARVVAYLVGVPRSGSASQRVAFFQRLCQRLNLALQMVSLKKQILQG